MPDSPYCNIRSKGTKRQRAKEVGGLKSDWRKIVGVSEKVSTNRMMTDERTDNSP